MKRKTFPQLSEPTVLMILAVLVVACLWPPLQGGMVGMTVHGALVLAFALYAVFVWREASQDERDVTHQMFAGRVAFFTTAALLIGWLLWQLYVMRYAETMLVIVIAAMIASKAAALVYLRRYC